MLDSSSVTSPGRGGRKGESMEWVWKRVCCQIRPVVDRSQVREAHLARGASLGAEASLQAKVGEVAAVLRAEVGEIAVTLEAAVQAVPQAVAVHLDRCRCNLIVSLE